MDKIKHSYAPTLDGWRAVAILAVIVCHAGDSIFWKTGIFANQTLYAATRRGSLGVDIFFGISGLLICGRLLEEEQQTGNISLRTFYLRRVFRILPPAFAYLITIGVLGVLGVIIVGWRPWLAAVCFIRNYAAPSQSAWYTGHFWSLAVEEHFYLIWPGVLLLCGSRLARRVVVLLALAIGIWRAFVFRAHWFPTVLPDASFYERTDIRLDALLWGCWMALELNVPERRSRLAAWLSGSVWATLLVLYALCVVYTPPLAMIWEGILIPLILSGTVLHAGRPIGTILEWTPIRWIGRISYSLYLWQQLFLIPHNVEFRLGVIQTFPVNLLALFLVAIASYYLLERPLIAFGRSLEGSAFWASPSLAATGLEG